MTKERERKHRGLYFRKGKEVDTWYMQVYHRGKEHRFSLGTTSLSKARREQAKALGDIDAFIEGKMRQRNQKHHKLSVFAEAYLDDMEKAGRRDMKRRRGCIKRLCEAFPKRHLGGITQSDIEGWVEGILSRKRSGPANVNRHLAYASHFFNFGIRRGLLKENPCRGIERLKEPKVPDFWLEPEQVDRLLALADPWFRPLLVLALETGMRRGEIANVMKSEVDRKNWLLHVRAPKNKEARYVPLTRRCREAILPLLQRLGHPYVFSGPEGEPLVQDWKNHLDSNGVPEGALQYREHLLRDAMERVIKKLSPEVPFSLHKLRHHCASWSAMRGVSEHATNRVLGWKTPAMAARYTHLRKEYLTAEWEKYEESELETRTVTSTAS